MQFQTPQFIDVEDKIFGPLTFKQFLYLAGGAGISFVLYRALPFFFAALLIIPIGGLSVALAFLRINERPFITVLEAAFNYSLNSKLYIWKQDWKKKETRSQSSSVSQQPSAPVPTLSQSKLKDMAWSLDVQKNIH